jgi:N-acetyl-gamma-glutamyl-phosphate reductase
MKEWNGMKTAVLGATGYTGLVLLRLLAEHPEVTEILAVSSSHTGEEVRSTDPGLPPSIAEKMRGSGGKFISIEQAVSLASAGGIDAVFAGLPHLKSAGICAPFIGKSVLIDLSADFRFKDPAVFAKAYGSPPPKPELLGKAVYGLAEWHREEIKKTDLIAQPGCYPTAALLPLLPLAREGLLKGTVIVNAISGISGAGKKERTDLLYCERTENAGAYNPGTSHRHAPEMRQELVSASPSLDLLFTPHLAPLKRGMTATTVAELTGEIPETGARSIEGIYLKYYGKEPFIQLTGARIPQSRDVWGSNRCDIGWRIESGHIMLFSVIDNLVKGASGNAVQCMNIRFGIDERAGLHSWGEL